MALIAFTTEIAEELIAKGYREAVVVPMGNMPRTDLPEEGWQVIPFMEQWEAEYYFDSLDDETMQQTGLMEMSRAAEELYEPIAKEDRPWLFIEEWKEVEMGAGIGRQHSTQLPKHLYPCLN